MEKKIIKMNIIKISSYTLIILISISILGIIWYYYTLEIGDETHTHDPPDVRMDILIDSKNDFVIVTILYGRPVWDDFTIIIDYFETLSLTHIEENGTVGYFSSQYWDPEPARDYTITVILKENDEVIWESEVTARLIS